MSHECTRDQYPFNEQMRTGTGPALVNRGVPVYCCVHPIALICYADKRVVNIIMKVYFERNNLQLEYVR